jgi:hypothetical protein
LQQAEGRRQAAAGGAESKHLRRVHQLLSSDFDGQRILTAMRLLSLLSAPIRVRRLPWLAPKVRPQDISPIVPATPDPDAAAESATVSLIQNYRATVNGQTLQLVRRDIGRQPLPTPTHIMRHHVAMSTLFAWLYPIESDISKIPVFSAQ